MTTPQGKKILIVEDEATLRKPLSDQLRFEGFSVIEAVNGLEGLEAAKREHPDLVLLDVIMPRMGGIQMLNELRKDEWGANALVILLTNSTDYKNVAGALEGRVRDYFVKSDWDILELIKKIKDKLGLH